MTVQHPGFKHGGKTAHAPALASESDPASPERTALAGIDSPEFVPFSSTLIALISTASFFVFERARLCIISCAHVVLWNHVVPFLQQLFEYMAVFLDMVSAPAF